MLLSACRFQNISMGGCYVLISLSIQDYFDGGVLCSCLVWLLLSLIHLSRVTTFVTHQLVSCDYFCHSFTCLLWLLMSLIHLSSVTTYVTHQLVFCGYFCHSSVCHSLVCLLWLLLSRMTFPAVITFFSSAPSEGVLESQETGLQ